MPLPHLLDNNLKARNRLRLILPLAILPILLLKNFKKRVSSFFEHGLGHVHEYLFYLVILRKGNRSDHESIVAQVGSV